MTMSEESTLKVPTLTASDYIEELDESDNEPPVAEQVFLDWRLDPTSSHSDWTIEIVTKDEEQKPKVVEYHVHKVMLTVGPRKSGYFQKICRQDAEFHECTTCSSRIELEKIAADAFPVMLDYLYQQISQVQFQFETQSATALHFLGQYLDIHALRWDALQFIKNDLSLSKCLHYYSHACILQNKKILGVTVDHCAKQLCEINPTEHPIVATADFQFWIEVLRTYEGTPLASCHASCLVEHICKEREPNLGAFNQLTNEDVMPNVDKTAALGLLATEANLVNYGDLSELTSLQKRCIRVLSQSHQQLLGDGEVAPTLAKQGVLFLASILTQALAFSAAQLDAKTSVIAEKCRLIAAQEREIKSLTFSLSRATSVQRASKAKRRSSTYDP